LPTAGQTKPKQSTQTKPEEQLAKTALAIIPLPGSMRPRKSSRGLSWVERFNSKLQAHFKIFGWGLGWEHPINGKNQNHEYGLVASNAGLNIRRKKPDSNTRVVRVIEFCGASSLASIYLTTYCVCLAAGGRGERGWKGWKEGKVRRKVRKSAEWSAGLGRVVGHYVRITRRKGYGHRNCIGRTKHGAQLSVVPPATHFSQPTPTPFPNAFFQPTPCGLRPTHVSNFVRGLLNFFAFCCSLPGYTAAFIWPKRNAFGIFLIWLPPNKKSSFGYELFIIRRLRIRFLRIRGCADMGTWHRNVLKVPLLSSFRKRKTSILKEKKSTK